MYISKNLVKRIAKTQEYKHIIEHKILDDPNNYKELVKIYDENDKSIDKSISDKRFIDSLEKYANKEIYERYPLFNMSSNFVHQIASRDPSLKFILIYYIRKQITTNIKGISEKCAINSFKKKDLIDYYMRFKSDIIIVNNH